MRTLPCILGDLKARLETARASIEIAFPYFIDRAAPVTGTTPLIDYACSFGGEVDLAAE